ncbi:MAG: hypothetical protein P1P90_05550 [Patescibacteria group bacterium]|nr:hypothetical protein [Patescibacteria group bacterium]
MKNLFAQILFSITFLLAVISSGCGGPNHNAQPETPDKKAALARLNVMQEGIQQDDFYLYSTKCWISAIKRIADDFANEEARSQLKEFCPSSDTSSSNTQVQIVRVGDCSCALVTVPKTKACANESYRYINRRLAVKTSKLQESKIGT